MTVYNCRSGISLTFSGSEGTDWQEEYYYHDPMIHDRKVVYIRAATDITMSHNSYDVCRINDSANYICQQSGLEPNHYGTIRYKVDRDLQTKYYWTQHPPGDTVDVCPAYSAPFAFEDLEYESEVPVVGTTGDNGEDIEDREAYYYRGIEDAFGDEWHVIAFADDDYDWNTTIGDPPQKLNEWWRASDGKFICFVVNPKTPCLSLEAQTGGEFYTTPAKTYHVPKIHTQTTYFTGNLNITLTNIMSGASCYYKWDDAETYTEYTSPVTTNSLDNGTHTLHYYYDGDHIKTRTFVKNPAFPSAGETHGYLFYPTDADWSAAIARLTTSPYSLKWPSIWRDQTGWTFTNREKINTYAGLGYRIETNTLAHALGAKVEGWTTVPTKPTGNTHSWGWYAKRGLLENIFHLDYVGLETLPPGTEDNPGIPCQDRFMYGYRECRPPIESALAYDIVAKWFKSTDQTGGMTVIEDFLIRDALASEVFKSFWICGSWSVDYVHSLNMSHACVVCAAIVMGMAMPTYSSSCYGTSGFDGVTTTLHPWSPYPNCAKTWKGYFYDCDWSPPQLPSTFPGYPNQAFDTDINTWMWNSVGNLDDPFGLPYTGWRTSYYNPPNMGWILQLTDLVIRNWNGTTKWPRYALSIARAASGTLCSPDHAVEHPDEENVYRPQLICCNQAFGSLCSTVRTSMKSFEGETPPYEDGPFPQSVTNNLQSAGVVAFMAYDETYTPDSGGDKICLIMKS